MSEFFPMFDEVVEDKPYRPLTDWAGKVGLATIEDVTGSSTNMEAFMLRVKALEDRVAALNKTNITPVVSTSSATVKDETADIVITAGDVPVTEVSTVTGKSVEVKSMNVESTRVTFKAVEGDVTVSGYKSTGAMEGKVCEAVINSKEHVKITDSEFAQSGYNAINIGDGNTTPENAPKSILIDNVKFNGTLGNNAISIYGQAEGATITLSNCHFEGVSNPLRLFNKTNTSCVVNVINCTVTSWESDPGETQWAGFLLLEDAYSGSVEKEIENNVFAPKKITVNFINCTGPNGKKFTAFGEPSAFCGTQDKTQLVYVYPHKQAKVLPYGDGSFYPTITVK